MLHQARGVVRLIGRSRHPGETCQASMTSSKVSSVSCNCARQDAMGTHAYIGSSGQAKRLALTADKMMTSTGCSAKGGIRGLTDACTLPG